MQARMPAVGRGLGLLLLVAALWPCMAGENCLSAVETARLLSKIVERTGAASAEGKKPAAVFDIDDTLLLTAPRTKAILLDFVRDHGADYPGLAGKVNALQPDKMDRGIVANLRLLDIPDENKRKELIKYWRPRFLGNDYLTRDWPLGGALELVKKLRERGAVIVYCTARPSESMRAGTETALRHFGFPIDEQARLVMNVDNQPAPSFKAKVVGELQKTGVVTGIFENEPDNLTAMYLAAPGAQPVFIDTVFTPGAKPLDPKIPRVKNFVMDGAGKQ